MKIYHGIRFYAVDSRDMGTFGGRAKHATIKIYRSDNANAPVFTITEKSMVETFRKLVIKYNTSREDRDRTMRKFAQISGER